jgi:hypothetical protein
MDWNATFASGTEVQDGRYILEKRRRPSGSSGRPLKLAIE